MPSLLPDVPQVAAWLLAGGASRRMGRDKALLLHHGEPLLVNRLKLLRAVCGEVQVLAPVGKYRDWGISGIADLRPGCGPLGGIETALRLSHTEWNLIFACDLPHVDADWLNQLLLTARDGLDCIASEDTDRGTQPLCALWRKSALLFVESSLDAGNFRVLDVLNQLNLKRLPCPHAGMLANWNEPADCGR